MHVHGIEHHTKGVDNCMAAINLVVASGRIGREGCGYAMITGQGNGQGGREQGQKCEQLPGGREIDNPEHRNYIAGVWGVPEASIPHKGRDVHRIDVTVEQIGVTHTDEYDVAALLMGD